MRSRSTDHEQFACLEGAHDHDGAAGQQGAEEARPADVRVQAERAQRARAPVIAQREGQVIGPVEPPPVRVDDALRQARRARAVDDVALVVVGDSRVDRPVGLRVAPGAEFLPARLHRLVCDEGAWPHAAEARSQLLEPGALVAGCHRRHRLRIRSHRHDGVVRDREVERHRDAARLEDAPDRLEHLGAVVHQHEDPLAATHAEPPQPVRDAVGPGIEIAPGENPIAVDDRRLVAEPLAVQGDDFRKERRRGLEPGHVRAVRGTLRVAAPRPRVAAPRGSRTARTNSRP